MSIVFKLDKDKSKEEVITEITNQLNSINNKILLSKIEIYLINPTLHMVIWDYKEETKMPAWLILKSEKDNTAILYSEYGFNFGNWGMVKLLVDPMHFGMDSQWYTSLEEAFMDTWMSEYISTQ